MRVIDKIIAAVGKRVTTPAIPFGYTAQVLPEHEPPVDDERDERAGLSYFIRYNGGSLSERRVTIKSLRVAGASIEHILGYCHERRALRLFRADRISEAVDITTGEVFSRQSLCSSLLNRGIPIAEQRLAAMIRILVFMARCDGQAHHLEWEEIDRAIVRLSRCLIDDDRAIDDLLTDARRLAPDGADFIRALKGLTKTRLPSRMHQELRRGIGAVIEADGVQCPEEIEWAIEAARFIDRMPTSG